MPSFIVTSGNITCVRRLVKGEKQEKNRKRKPLPVLKLELT